MIDAGEPTVLLGTDSGPNAAEYLLHALAACLTTTIVYCAAARKIRLTEIESTFEADMDVRGCFGLDPEVRNGFKAIRGDVPRQRRRLRREAARARRPTPRSAPRCSTCSPTASPSSARRRHRASTHPRVRASGAKRCRIGRDLVTPHDEPVVGARPAREQPSPVG